MRQHEGHIGERSSAKARWASLAAAGIVLSISAAAHAQQPPPPPPPQPPPGFEAGQPGTAQPPPPGYGTPPPGYGAAPGYGAPPPGYYAAPGGAPVMGPKVLDWDENEPLRPGYHPDTRIRKGLVIGGAVTFGVTYLVTALVAAAATDISNSSSATPLFVPAIGPFIAAGTIKNTGATGAFFLVLDGLVQCGGIAMFVAGLAAPKTVQVRNDAALTHRKEAKAFVSPAPMTFGANSGGLGLVGKF